MTGMERDRYEGLAEWYDEVFFGYQHGPSSRALARLLGRGDGLLCLDLGCGGGLHVAAVESTGRRVVGVERSASQLRVAATRLRRLVQADALSLPFPADTFPTVVSTFTHTDVDDFPRLVAEAARVLRPGGAFVYVGVHPCFVNHAAERHADAVVVHAAYAEAGWHDASSRFRDGGLRARVGERHVPLGEFVMAFVAAGLRIEHFEELTGGFGLGEEDAARSSSIPGAVAVAASKR
jgi:SAM-dependent methyltransferase